MKWVKLRWLLAACTLLLSIKLMVKAYQIESMGAAFPVLMSVGSFLATVLLIAPETARRLAEWCARPFANIFFPSDEFSRPPLSYKLARHYRQTQRWKDAAQQYRKIIRYYPSEKDAYLELLDVAEQMGDTESLRKYKSLYRKRFKEDLPHKTA